SAVSPGLLRLFSYQEVDVSRGEMWPDDVAQPGPSDESGAVGNLALAGQAAGKHRDGDEHAAKQRAGNRGDGQVRPTQVARGKTEDSRGLHVAETEPCGIHRPQKSIAAAHRRETDGGGRKAEPLTRDPGVPDEEHDERGVRGQYEGV